MRLGHIIMPSYHELKRGRTAFSILEIDIESGFTEPALVLGEEQGAKFARRRPVQSDCELLFGLSLRRQQADCAGSNNCSYKDQAMSDRQHEVSPCSAHLGSATCDLAIPSYNDNAG